MKQILLISLIFITSIGYCQEKDSLKNDKYFVAPVFEHGNGIYAFYELNNTFLKSLEDSLGDNFIKEELKKGNFNFKALENNNSIDTALIKSLTGISFDGYDKKHNFYYKYITVKDCENPKFGKVFRDISVYYDTKSFAKYLVYKLETTQKFNVVFFYEPEFNDYKEGNTIKGQRVFTDSWYIDGIRIGDEYKVKDFFDPYVLLTGISASENEDKINMDRYGKSELFDYSKSYSQLYAQRKGEEKQEKLIEQQKQENQKQLKEKKKNEMIKQIELMEKRLIEREKQEKINSELKKKYIENIRMQVEDFVKWAKENLK